MLVDNHKVRKSFPIGLCNRFLKILRKTNLVSKGLWSFPSLLLCRLQIYINGTWNLVTKLVKLSHSHLGLFRITLYRIVSHLVWCPNPINFCWKEFTKFSLLFTLCNICGLKFLSFEFWFSTEPSLPFTKRALNVFSATDTE